MTMDDSHATDTSEMGGMEGRMETEGANTSETEMME
jgi:hypothetical protein